MPIVPPPHPSGTAPDRPSASNARVVLQRAPARVIDSTEVGLRLIRRAATFDTGAVQVLPGQWWAPAPQEAVTGPTGWQSATVERRARDHGLLSQLAFPNTEGADRMLHRDRFAVGNDPDYRLGTEWVEFRDVDTGRALFVATPDSLRVDRANVALTGVDAGGLLAGFRNPKVAPWTPHAPQDVVDWHSYAPTVAVHHPYSSGVGEYPATTMYGATATVQPDGLRLSTPASFPAGSPTSSRATVTIPATSPTRPRGWIATVRVRLLASDVGAFVVKAAGDAWLFAVSSAGITVRTANVATVTSRVLPDVGQSFAMEVVAIDGWLVFSVDGKVVEQLRRTPGVDDMPEVTIEAGRSTVSTDVLLESFTVRKLQPFLRRGAPPADSRVAGAPTPGGLRGDYFLTYDKWARSGSGTTAVRLARYGAQVPAPYAEPYQRRLDPTIAFGGSPPTWQPPGPPNGEGFSVRWSGSIYLDIEASPNLRLRLLNVDDMARLWLGDTTAEAAYLDLWGIATSPGQSGVVVRDHLGTTRSGWYPIVLEFAQGPSGGAGLTLQSSTDSSTWTTVPATGLSPYGCWEGDLGGESHREALDSVTTSMGLVWRLQPRLLESGEFPGRLEAAASLGRETSYVVGEDEATEYASEISATETVDHIVADAAGLGDNLGREGLTAEILNPGADSEPWLASRAESLGDITEATLLQQRLSSLLALYGTPAETVAARPRGQDELVDSFPTAGAASLFLWEPDDGVRLDLPTIGVRDVTTRRITSAAWPLSPAGRGAPSIGFRQRPKHLRAVFQRLMRQTVVQRRHYQGQLAQVTGSVGSTSATLGDGFSRIGVTAGTVAVLAVRILSVVGDGGSIEVNGVDTGLVVTRPGDYDVTAWLRTSTVQQEARLINAGSTAYVLQLVGTVRV